MAKLSKKEQLLRDVKTELPVKLPKKDAVPKGELGKITFEIQSALGDIEDLARRYEDLKNEVQEIKERKIKLDSFIMEKLQYVSDNRKRLLGDRSFTDYLKEDLDISKTHYYRLAQAYQVLKSAGKTNMYDDERVDMTKVAKLAALDVTEQKAVLKDTNMIYKDSVLAEAGGVGMITDQSVRPVLRVNQEKRRIIIPMSIDLDEIISLLGERFDLTYD